MSAVKDGRRGHFWMHDAVLDDYGAELGVYGLSVYAMLCRRANKHGVSHPSIRRLADDLGISERQAKRELKKLKDLGLIAIEQRSEQNKTSLYTILEVPTRPGDSESPGDSQSPDPVPVSHPKEDTVEGSKEAKASKATPTSETIIPLDKYTTDRMYTAFKEAGYPRWTQDEYGFHLSRVQQIIAEDSPTDDELMRLPEEYVALYTNWNRKADAVLTLREMRVGARRENNVRQLRPVKGPSEQMVSTAGYRVFE